MWYVVSEDTDYVGDYDESYAGCLRGALYLAEDGDSIGIDGSSLFERITYLEAPLYINKEVTVDAVEPKEFGPDPMNPGAETENYLYPTFLPDGTTVYGINNYTGETIYIQSAATFRGLCFNGYVDVETDGVVFEKCTFYDNSVILEGTASFIDCKFIVSGTESITRTNAIFAEAGQSTSDKTFSFTNCVFEANLGRTTLTSGVAAIKAGANNVELQDCTFKKYTNAGAATVYDLETTFGSTSFDRQLTLTGVTTLNNGYKTDYAYIETNGFGGISSIISSANTIKAQGTGVLAVPSSVTFATIANTVTRCVYGAGASRFQTSNGALSWASVDSTKTVALFQKNGSAWNLVNAAASSPVSSVTTGVYAIFDGETFRTRTVTSAPRNLVVTNTNDSGEGSLRAMIAEANADDTITFDASLTGETIVLFSTLETETPITIIGPTTENPPDFQAWLEHVSRPCPYPAICLDFYKYKSVDYIPLGSSFESYQTGVKSRGMLAKDSLTISNVLFKDFGLYAGYDLYGGGLFCDYRNAPNAVATVTNCAFESFDGTILDNAFNGTNGFVTGTDNFPYGFFPPYPEPFNPGYGGAIAVYGGTATFTDCASFTTVSTVFGGGKGDVFAAFDADVTLTRYINAGSYHNWHQPFYFNNCDVTLNNVNFHEYSGSGECCFDGGTLTITDTECSIFDFFSQLTAPMVVNGHNFIRYFYGAISAVSGPGYLATENGVALSSATNNILLSNKADDLTGDAESLTFTSNGETLIEKQVGSNWQKVGITPYQDAGESDPSKRPQAASGGIPFLPVDPETGEQPPYFMPDPMWSPISDPRDPSYDTEDPGVPYIPNPDLSQDVVATFPSPGETTLDVETVYTTTYRVWSPSATTFAGEFVAYTVQGEDPPEPEPPTPPEPVAVRPGRLVRAQLQMTYENEGETAIPAGTPIQIGSAFGVAEVAIPAGATGVISILGTWIFPCADTTAANMGDVACWDDTNKVITTAPSGSSTGLTTEYNAVSESGGTVTFSVADSTGWAVGDLFHIDDDEWTLEVTATTATTIKGQYVVQPQGYLEPDMGTLVQEVEAPDVLPVGAFVNAVSSGETTATVMIYPAAPVNGESSSSEESGGGD